MDIDKGLILLGKISVKEEKRMLSVELAALLIHALHVQETGLDGWITSIPSLLQTTHKLKPHAVTG